MSDLKDHIEKALRKQVGTERPLTQYRFLLAVSGGVDSMVMAHLFLELGLSFGIAHFNFQLRGVESDKDALLVQSFCKKNDLPFHLRSADTYRKSEELQLSIQETARHLRYQFFEEVCTGHPYDFVCTAHHAHDQLETFFIHLLRGSGLKGLTGIPPRRGSIIRPMLQIPLAAIERYAGEQKVEYREDQSNLSDEYLRNKIRIHITEPLIAWDDSVLTNAMKSIDFVAEAQEFIEGQMKQFKKKFFKNPIHGIQWFDIRRPEILSDSNRFLLKEILRESRLYMDSIVNLLANPAELKTGSQFPGVGINAYFDRGKVWLVSEDLFLRREIWMEIKPGEPLRSEEGDLIELRKEGFDQDSFLWFMKINPSKIEFPLVVRRWNPGDVIWQGKTPFFRKSVKKVLSENKIPLPFKDRVRILADAKDQIISVLGFAQNAKVLVGEGEEGLWLGYQSEFWEKVRIDID